MEYSPANKGREYSGSHVAGSVKTGEGHVDGGGKWGPVGVVGPTKLGGRVSVSP